MVGQPSQELVRHGYERLLWPAIEPVKRAAVDERGEHAGAYSKELTHRRHAQHDVEVVSQRLNVLLLYVVLVNWDFLLCQEVCQVFTHLSDVGGLVKTRNVSCVEDVVNVLEERLVHDLSVIQDEGGRFLLAARNQHPFFNLLSEFGWVKIFGEHELEGYLLKDEGGKLGQALLAASTYSDKHSVASRLHKDAHNAADVDDGIIEEDEIHFVGALQVVVRQFF